MKKSSATSVKYVHTKVPQWKLWLIISQKKHKDGSDFNTANKNQEDNQNTPQTNNSSLVGVKQEGKVQKKSFRKRNMRIKSDSKIDPNGFSKLEDVETIGVFKDCMYCSKSVDKNEWNEHIELCKNQIQCEVKAELKEEILGFEPNESIRKVECPMCFKQCTFLSDLEDHMTKFHRIPHSVQNKLLKGRKPLAIIRENL